MCVLLIVGAVVFYSAVVTPQIFARHGFAAGSAHTLFGLSLCHAFGFSYWHLLTTSPGTTKDVGRERLEALMPLRPRRRRREGERKCGASAAIGSAAQGEAEEEEHEEEHEEEGNESWWRYCDKCELPKPPLAHHCSVCRCCVLRADHHCPWFANCLGFGNYRHFFLFLVYLSVGAAYACATTYAVHASDAVRDPWRYRWHVALALLSGGLALALAALLGWHLVCLWTGLGTLEMMDRVLGWHGEEEEEDEEEGERRGQQQRRKTKNPPPHVSLKSLRDYPWNLGLERNVRLAFDLDDDRGFWWVRWLRVHGARRKGDGVVFPTKEKKAL